MIWIETETFFVTKIHQSYIFTCKPYSFTVTTSCLLARRICDIIDVRLRSVSPFLPFSSFLLLLLFSNKQQIVVFFFWLLDYWLRGQWNRNRLQIRMRPRRQNKPKLNEKLKDAFLPCNYFIRLLWRIMSAHRCAFVSPHYPSLSIGPTCQRSQMTILFPFSLIFIFSVGSWPRTCKERRIIQGNIDACCRILLREFTIRVSLCERVSN